MCWTRWPRCRPSPARKRTGCGGRGRLAGHGAGHCAAGHESVDDRHGAQEDRISDASEGGAGTGQRHRVHEEGAGPGGASSKFDVITSRAFADLSDFVNWSGHLLAEGGQFIALKGTAPPEEQERLPEEWKVSELRPIQVPGLQAERHLVFIQNQSKHINRINGLYRDILI